MVGAVVVDRDGAAVAEGWHRGAGAPHAEADALRTAGERARGGTLYVSLEPCSHQGRTPPCVEAVIASGVARVVAPIQDPNPLVHGEGFARLRAAGVAVEVGLLADEAATLIEAFAKAVTTGTPFVTLKLAMSLDGKVAARDGTSRWITGEAARADVHRLRSEHDAVMVGAGTAVADDPALTVRLDDYRGRQPVRIVVDGAGRTPASGRIFDGSAPLWMLTSAASSTDARGAWAEAGARVVVAAGGPAVGLTRALADLGSEGTPLRSVLIEGGPTLAWSAVREGVVDRVVIYIAPKLVGGVAAPSALGGEGIASIADAIALRIDSVAALGEDLRIVGRPRSAGSA
jgi:diaminohydroxyphosphoribosylaminopyrimidine deaminase/5-amino-6-(5-phosphoribosylamino)uracil reductase